MKKLALVLSLTIGMMLGGCSGPQTPPIGQNIQIFHKVSKVGWNTAVTVIWEKEGWLVSVFHAEGNAATQGMVFIPDRKHSIDWKTRSQVYLDYL
jgi:hypothetical protein